MDNLEMADGPDLHNLIMAVGEMRGKMQQIVDSTNSTATKVDTLSAMAAAAATLPEAVRRLEARLDLVEQDKQRREGANSFVLGLMKSPALGWMVGGITTIWLMITGRLDI